MSICEITKLSEAQQKSWPLMHKSLTSGTKIELSEQAKGLDSIKIGSIAKKSVESLSNHLSKLITRILPSAKLNIIESSIPFLASNGEFAINLVIESEDLKRTSKRICGLLKDRDMQNVHTSGAGGRRNIRFRDGRSGFSVNLKLNDPIAIREYELLESYAKSDERFTQLMKAVSYWTINRNINDNMRGFGQDCWSVLIIQYLQTLEKPILPNLQAGDSREILEFSGRSFDITLSQSEPLTGNESTLESLFAGFISWLNSINWDSSIISIRNGEPIERDSKGWSLNNPTPLEALLNTKNRNARIGEHRLAIESVFDSTHDISEPIDARFWFDLFENVSRAVEMINKGTEWVNLCEVIHPERLALKENEDLFADLRQMKEHEISKKLEELLKQREMMEKRLNALEEERTNSIRLANAMRGVVEETSSIRKEHKEIITQLGPRNKEIQNARKERDEINSKIVLPLHVIEEEMKRAFGRLSGEFDMERIPSLENERKMFSWFFELQQMHAHAKRAGELHSRVINLITIQKDQVSELKLVEKKHDKTTGEMLKDEPQLKDSKPTMHEAMAYDRKAAKVMRSIRSRRKEMKEVRREIGRLEAWKRKGSKSGTQSRGKGRRKHHDGRPSKQQTEQVREKAASGGSLSLGDLDILLKTGGLSKVAAKEESPSSAKKSKKSGMSKLRNLSTQRGKPGRAKRER